MNRSKTLSSWLPISRFPDSQIARWNTGSIEATSLKLPLKVFVERQGMERYNSKLFERSEPRRLRSWYPISRFTDHQIARWITGSIEATSLKLPLKVFVERQGMERYNSKLFEQSEFFELRVRLLRFKKRF